MRRWSLAAAGLLGLALLDAAGCGGAPAGRDAAPLALLAVAAPAAMEAPAAPTGLALRHGLDHRYCVRLPDYPSVITEPLSHFDGASFYLGIQGRPLVTAGGELLGVGLGYGGGLTIGCTLNYALSWNLALETIFDFSTHDDNLVRGASALLAHWTCGAKLNFRAEEYFQPFLVAGGGLYSVLFEGAGYPLNDAIFGGGGYLGGGFNVFVTDGVALGLDARFHVWYGMDDNLPKRGGLITNFELALTVGLYF